MREQGLQVREMGDKVRTVERERNDGLDRFGVELAEAISRVEAVSVDCCNI